MEKKNELAVVVEVIFSQMELRGNLWLVAEQRSAVQ